MNRELKLKLLCQGMRIDPSSGVGKGRTAGAGPLGQFIIIDGRGINVPTSGEAENSPFLLVKEGGKLKIKAEEIEIEVKLPERVKYYSQITSDGIPMRMIALRHGIDVLASTVYQKCLNWEYGKACKFCAIETSLEKGITTLLKTPAQLAEVAEAAWKNGDAVHATLTTGVPNYEDRGAKLLGEATKAIKKAVPEMKVHVQLTPPLNYAYFDYLADSGVDTIGLHLESADIEVLSKICPAKAELGVEHFYNAIKYCVGIFGENQVSSFLIAGLGEKQSSIFKACERLSQIGAVSYIVPFRPLPSTPLRSWKMPSYEYMHEVYVECGLIMKQYGIKPHRNKAGCVRCGGCSLIQDYI
ncbi:MAG: MSMEG_0568 family radical SAM protein [Methanocellales archaeon]